MLQRLIASFLAASLLAVPAGAVPLPETRAQAEARAAALHAQMDADGDGFVTPAELTAFARRRAIAAGGGKAPERMLPFPQELFDRADANRDGRISLAEATRGADRTFAAMDRDHDGIVTPAERLAYLRRFIAEHRMGDALPLPD